MSELIDRERFSADMRDFQNRVGIWRDEAEDTETRARADAALATIIETKLILDKQPTIAASPWHRVEDELPKSGTHVLVCCEVRGICGHRSRYVCDAFHTDAKSIPCRYDDDIDSEYDEETDEYYFPEGWWEVIKNWDYYTCVAIADFVTHWMPLPEPPKEDA